jgi:DNA ligase (NAD+)
MNDYLSNLESLSFIDFKKTIQKESTKNLLSLREYVDDLYYNSDENILSDSKYDYLKDELEKRIPSQKLKIGATLREGDNKIELPVHMGSMNKIYPEDISDYTKWISKNKGGKYVISEKLDGVSCLLVYQNKSISLYTRGDGTYGSDISYLADVLKLPKFKEDVMIRGELILSKKDFDIHFSKTYKNARNLVSGIVNAKTLKKGAEYLQFIPYEIIGESLSLSHQFDILKKLGFKTANYIVTKDIEISTLQSTLVDWKSSSEFEIDGIIVQRDSLYERNTSGNPDYAFAFKMVMDDAIVETKVIEVEWNLSKRGQLKPRLKIKPVNVSGVTINYVTAFNAKYIYTHKIGPGTIIQVTRSGEVIPYIVAVVKGSKTAQMPDVEYKWNETGVDILQVGESEELCLKIITYFFQVMGVKFVNEATIRKLMDNGFNTLMRIIQAKPGDFSEIEGLGEKSGNRIIENIHTSLQQVTLPKLMSASGIFGFGLGETKFKALLVKFPTLLRDYVKEGDAIKERINQIDGFSDKTTDKIVDNLDLFLVFLKRVYPYIQFKKVQKVDVKRFEGMKIVFTGFRDATLQELIEKEGGEVKTSVSKQTTLVVASDPSETTGKVANAKKYGIQVLSKKEFIDMYKI